MNLLFNGNKLKKVDIIIAKWYISKVAYERE